MAYIWTYFIMALCAGVTSAGVMDSPGNRNSLQDNLTSGLEYKKVLTPPTDGGLIIDSEGFPGNSNEPKSDLNEDQNLPAELSEIINIMNGQNSDLANYEIIPFTKEDFTNLENSEICRMMCKAKVNKPPCKCN